VEPAEIELTTALARMDLCPTLLLVVSDLHRYQESMLLAVEKAQPGMKLTRDALNLNGSVLLTAGTCLTPAQLRTLKMWGVEAIQIADSEPAGQPVDETKVAPPKAAPATDERLERRLKFVAEDTPGIGFLRNLAGKHLAKSEATRSLADKKTAA